MSGPRASRGRALAAFVLAAGCLSSCLTACAGAGSTSGQGDLDGGVAALTLPAGGVLPVADTVDEFDGTAGSAPSAALWTYDLGGGGWGNDELQTYTDDPANAALDGAGHLVITAERTSDTGYTSARVSTRGKRSFGYGTLQARIDLPRQAGILPAFWLLGSDLATVGYPAAGELDVAEAPDSSHVYATAHGPNADGTRWSAGGGTEGISPGFHVYTLQRTATQLVVHIDDKVVLNIAKAALPATQRWVFDRDFDVLLDIAVGGSFPGNPDAGTVFPARMTVDWIRFRS